MDNDTTAEDLIASTRDLGGPGAHLEYTLKKEHYKALVAALPWRASSARGRSTAAVVQYTIIGVVIGLAVTGVYIAADQYCSAPGITCTFDPPSVFVGAFTAFVLLWAGGTFIQSRNLERLATNQGAYLGTMRLRLNDQRVEVFGDHVRSTYDWEAFDSIERDKTILSVWIDRGIGFAIPRDAFASPAAEERFIRDFNTRLAAVKKPV